MLTWRDSPAAHAETGCEAFQQTLVFDELRHAFAEKLLRSSLRLRAVVESTPQPVDLILNIFCMRNKIFGIMSEPVSLGLTVFLVLAIVVCDLDKPDARADKDIDVFGKRLHVGHSLDGTCAGTYDGNAIVRPLLFLVIFWPTGSVDYLALEFIFEPGYIWPTGVSA